jgi:hypothetical protein
LRLWQNSFFLLRSFVPNRLRSFTAFRMTKTTILPEALLAIGIKEEKVG